MQHILEFIQAGRPYWVAPADINHPLIQKLFSYLRYAGGGTFSPRICSRYNINYMRSYTFPRCVSVNGNKIGKQLTPEMLICNIIHSRIP